MWRYHFPNWLFVSIKAVKVNLWAKGKRWDFWVPGGREDEREEAEQVELRKQQTEVSWHLQFVASAMGEG